MLAAPRHSYGLPARGEGYEFVNFLEALRAIGCVVQSFDTLDGSSTIQERVFALRDAIADFKPQLLLLALMVHEVPIEVLDAIRAMGIVVVNWFADDHWRYSSFSRFVSQHIDLAATTDEGAVERYRGDGRPVHLTQWAARSGYLSHPILSRDCRFDISFVGQAYGDRRSRIDALRRAGIEVRCFGHGWEGKVLDNEGMFDTLRSSRISLNFASSSHGSLLRGTTRQIKARVFEVTGAGGCLLTQGVDGLDKFFEVGKEVVTFDSDTELVQQVRRLISDVDFRDSVAAAGNARTRRDHTYEVRLRRLIDVALSGAPLAASRQPTLWPERASIPLAPPRWFVAVLRLADLLFPNRGQRYLRRLVFEWSWRTEGVRAYSIAGLSLRLFPSFPILAARSFRARPSSRA